MNWQPIETAPRDGTHVILSSPLSPNPFVGYFVDSEDFKYGKSVRKRQAWSGDGFSMMGVPDLEPTHWMPIPPPPKRGDNPNTT